MTAGCTSGRGEAGPTGTVDLDDLELVAALQRYDSCDAFLADVKADALERVGPYGLGSGPNWGFAMAAGRTAMEFATDDSAGADGATPPQPATTTMPDGLAGNGGDGDVSGTNVQERGVDEPDLVKTDGELLAVVTQQSLRLIDVSDPTDPQLHSTTPLAGWGAELLLQGDRLLVLQQVGDGWGGPVPADARDAIGAPVMTTIADELPGGSAGRIAPGWAGRQLATLTQLDVSDPARPTVERTWTIDGAYVSSRLVDGTARIVLRSDVATRLPFVFPSGPQAEEAATTANRAVIEASTIDDWVPTLTLSDASGAIVDEVRVAPCNQLYRPSVFAGFGMVSVLTADLGGRGLGVGDGVGVLSSGEIVYASPTSLYVATNRWIDPSEAAAQSSMPRPSGDQRTDVHQFATDGSGPARYLASGSVDGYLLNQFSMSEHDGHLRMAITEGQWDPGSASSVVVLARRGERLDEIGRVGDLGKGEQIYAVRFMGDMGYVVTFRQIDPLYTVDLSDPAAPRVLGELKIPGYSSYLHPLGDDLLLGVGQNATDEGRILGSQVSLFDVSNPADPRRIALLELGDGSSSEVEYDHRAFLVWRGLAVLPYVSYQWDRSDGGMETGAIGVTVDVEAGTLTERGRISHADQAGGVGDQQSSYYWEHQYGSQIRRSVVIGDTLLTLSDRGMLASDLASLSPQGWLSLGG
jgi:hypothetical protein